MQSYLARLVDRTRGILNENLVGLYLHGSAAQSNWIADSSDIDVIGLVVGPVSESERVQLARVLSHEQCPVPALGLEFIVCAQQIARYPSIDCRFEFALSTGASWGTDCETSGVAGDTLIDFALCRQSGRTLFGQRAKDAFEVIPIALLREALREELRWHLDELGRSHEPRLLVNSALNAARSVYAAQTGVILSKSEGARWWLNQNECDDLISKALALRHGSDASPLDKNDVKSFVKSVDSKIAALQE